MCGIVGYVGRRPVAELLLAGLGKLEYRGYDSAGISVIADGHIEAVRAVGNLSALLTLEALAGRDLSERDAMEKLPQRLVSVRVRDRDALAHAPSVDDAVRSAAQELAGRGRVLVRPSGTEPLVRVMVEAPTDQQAQDVCERLVGLVRRELG